MDVISIVAIAAAAVADAAFSISPLFVTCVHITFCLVAAMAVAAAAPQQRTNNTITSFCCINGSIYAAAAVYTDNVN